MITQQDIDATLVGLVDDIEEALKFLNQTDPREMVQRDAIAVFSAKSMLYKATGRLSELADKAK
jgi:hypothetical protein